MSKELNMDGAFVYILRRSDGSYYTGIARRGRKIGAKSRADSVRFFNIHTCVYM